MILLVGMIPARSETIYVWRDSTGVSHYTTDPEAVPVEYRESAIPVVPGEAGSVDDGDASNAPVASMTADAGSDGSKSPRPSPEPVVRDRTPVERRRPPEGEPPSVDEARSLLERQRRARRSAWEGD